MTFKEKVLNMIDARRDNAHDDYLYNVEQYKKLAANISPENGVSDNFINIKIAVELAGILYRNLDILHTHINKLEENDSTFQERLNDKIAKNHMLND